MGGTFHDHLGTDIKTDLRTAGFQLDFLARRQSISLGQSQLISRPAHGGKTANAGHAAVSRIVLD